MYEDNTACIEWSNHVIGRRERAKHINIQNHFAHEMIQERAMKLIKVDDLSQERTILCYSTSQLHTCVTLRSVDGALPAFGDEKKALDFFKGKGTSRTRGTYF